MTPHHGDYMGALGDGTGRSQSETLSSMSSDEMKSMSRDVGEMRKVRLEKSNA